MTQAFENGSQVSTVEPDIFFDENPEQPTTSDYAIVTTVAQLISWAGRRKSRLIVIEKLCGQDTRTIAEIARLNGLSRQCVTREFWAGIEFLKRTR